MTIVAHVDDFLCLGSRAALDSLLVDIKTEYECDGDILGPGADEAKKLKFLGRTITYTSEGVEWESDQEHCEAFFQKLGVDSDKLHGVQTPGVKEDDEKAAVDKVGEMTSSDSKLYRGCVALLNSPASRRTG